MEAWLSMTHEERMSEVGTEPDCPFCLKPRVSRSDYIRCNGCGVNWLDSEMGLPDYLSLDPRVARRGVAPTGSGTQPTVGSLAAVAEA